LGGKAAQKSELKEWLSSEGIQWGAITIRTETYTELLERTELKQSVDPHLEILLGEDDDHEAA
jgi:hypothetical protein